MSQKPEIPPLEPYKALLAPRWPNGPGICPETRLPAFKDAGEARKFQSLNAPGHTITRIGQCRVCGWWHYKAKMRGPSGTTSGHERSDTLPKDFKPFMRKSTSAAIELRKMIQREKYERFMAGQSKPLDEQPKAA